MPRTADYTIQGFLYQFHKTLSVILNSSDESEITIEGPIEDIDVSDGSSTEAIQCKYHEAQSNFQLSLIYKPILQMMDHFQSNSDKEIRYTLFAYFPDHYPKSNFSLKRSHLEQILKTTNESLKKYADILNESKVDIDEFL